MQTQQGKPALSPTAQEIQDLVKAVVAEIAAQTCAEGEEPDTLKPFPAGFVPCISLDNAPVHTRAKEAMVAQHMPCTFERIPPYSPDIHKVIEHVHGIVQRAFQRNLLRRSAENLPDTVPELFATMRSIFDRKVTTTLVRKDILSLQATLQAIIDNKGRYPERKLR